MLLSLPLRGFYVTSRLRRGSEVLVSMILRWPIYGYATLRQPQAQSSIQESNIASVSKRNIMDQANHRVPTFSDSV
ncbi:hypothetical protein DIRU0_D24916 [Diutina rugosa]